MNSHKSDHQITNTVKPISVEVIYVKEVINFPLNKFIKKTALGLENFLKGNHIAWKAS